MCRVPRPTAFNTIRTVTAPADGTAAAPIDPTVATRLKYTSHGYGAILSIIPLQKIFMTCKSRNGRNGWKQNMASLLEIKSTSARDNGLPCDKSLLFAQEDTKACNTRVI